MDGEALILKLDPTNRPDQVLTRKEAEAKLAGFKRMIESKKHMLVIEFAKTLASSSLASVPPPLPEGQYDRALLRFRDLGDVLSGEDAARRCCPDLAYFVRYRSGIDKFQAVRFMVEGFSIVLDIAFVFAMLFVVGMLAYLHAVAKLAEAGVLRSFGLSSRGIGQLFLAQLGLLVLPSCVVGIALARAAAWLSNDWVAWRLAPPSPGDLVPAVFASGQGDALAGAGWVLCVGCCASQ
jgi:hypothetical protein